MEEGTTLYRGWGWTMARNAPGSFAVSHRLSLSPNPSTDPPHPPFHLTFYNKQLFGASAVTKEYALGVTDYSKATWTQNFIASIAGAVASITVAAPLDTVKTRIQNANFEHKVPGLTVVKDLIKNEGPTAFFKGLTPKVSFPSYTDWVWVSWLIGCLLCRFLWWGRSWCLVIHSLSH
jgi:hypothetical protein